jgi:hypothetical protein
MDCAADGTSTGVPLHHHIAANTDLQCLDDLPKSSRYPILSQDLVDPTTLPIRIKSAFSTSDIFLLLNAQNANPTKDSTEARIKL